MKTNGVGMTMLLAAPGIEYTLLSWVLKEGKNVVVRGCLCTHNHNERWKAGKETKEEKSNTDWR